LAFIVSHCRAAFNRAGRNAHFLPFFLVLCAS
jgi:hypothetical protein